MQGRRLAIGIAGFPSVQQTRFVTLAPTLASATIALNSSMSYLGNSVGTKLGSYAWGWVGGRYLPWIAFLFVSASMGCSFLADRAAKQFQSH